MDHYHLRRIEVGTGWTGESLIKLLSTGRLKHLPYSGTFTSDSGWRGTWGKISFNSDNTLHLEAVPSTTGSFAFLDGTREYRDYMYSISAFLEKGSRISLVTRFVDSNNNVACVFGPETVRIEEQIFGQIHLLAQIKSNVDLDYTNPSLAVSVVGSTINCFEGSSLVLSSSDLDENLDSGGIGLRVWDPVKNNASLFVSSLKAVSIENSNDLISSLPTYKSNN